jgi:hypothetical protein
MKRSHSAAAALSVAFLAAGVVDSSAAAPRVKLLPGGLDPVKVEARLQAAGLSADQILEVTAFLALDRVGQLVALRSAGFVDPGGDLATDAAAADYLLGQYLVQRGVNPVKGIQLQLNSGKLSAAASLELAQTLKPEDIEVSDTEIDQQVRAAGGPEKMDRDTALLRGRLQKAATYLRGPLSRSLPSLAEVWIDNKDGFKLVVSLAGPAEELGRAIGRPDFAGLPIDVRTVRYSATTLNGMAQGVRRQLTAGMPGAKVSVAADTIASVVRVRAADAATDKKVRGNPTVKDLVAKGDVAVDPPRDVAPSSVVGGHATQTGGCRWAFSSTRGSDKVLVTAGHCNASGYGLYIPSTLQQEKVQGAVDAERHSVDPFFYDQFDNFVERPGLPDLEITGKKKWEEVGYSDVVCHSGYTHSCGYVTNRYYQPYWIAVNPNFFVQVESPTLVEQGGDSGGPWYYGNSAYGIHAGGCHCFGDSSSWGLGIYGAIDFAERDLGFTVMTK